VLTQAAIALPEIQAPERTRVYCMAVTNDNVSGATRPDGARPRSGGGRAMIADDDGEQENEDGAEAARPKRFAYCFRRECHGGKPTTLTALTGEYPIEDPAQAWNALTIGVHAHDLYRHVDEMVYPPMVSAFMPVPGVFDRIFVL